MSGVLACEELLSSHPHLHSLSTGYTGSLAARQGGQELGIFPRTVMSVLATPPLVHGDPVHAEVAHHGVPLQPPLHTHRAQVILTLITAVPVATSIRHIGS